MSEFESKETAAVHDNNNSSSEGVTLKRDYLPSALRDRLKNRATKEQQVIMRQAFPTEQPETVALLEPFAPITIHQVWGSNQNETFLCHEDAEVGGCLMCLAGIKNEEYLAARAYFHGYDEVRLLMVKNLAAGESGTLHVADGWESFANFIESAQCELPRYPLSFGKRKLNKEATGKYAHYNFYLEPEKTRAGELYVLPETHRKYQAIKVAMQKTQATQFDSLNIFKPYDLKKDGPVYPAIGDKIKRYLGMDSVAQ